MLIVWSGWGFLTVAIVAVVSIVVGAILSLMFAALGVPQLTFLAVSIGLFSAAAANWFIGKRFNDKPGRELVDPQTGQRVLLVRRHKLFWINMEYWSIPVAVAALFPLLAIASLFHR